MSNALQWGVMGTGNIARQFAEGVRAGARRSQLAAVGSRSAESARAFADKHGIPAAHGSYEALLADARVEAIYLSLPNALHHEWTIKALRAGKHVLCEKPFATSAAQAREMFDVAQQAGRVLVEAFMYRSHPMMKAIVDEVRGGAIGRPKLIRASFCFKMNQWQGNVRFNPGLAGGGIMDVGCYCVSFCRLIAGAEPTKVHCSGHLHESGVDDYAAGVLTFPNGVAGVFTCGMTLHADNTTQVFGDEGFITIPVPWKPGEQGGEYTVQGMTPARSDTGAKAPAARRTERRAADRPLYALEADDFAATVQDGAAPAVTAADTLGNMAVLDELRKQVGLPY